MNQRRKRRRNLERWNKAQRQRYGLPDWLPTFPTFAELVGLVAMNRLVSQRNASIAAPYFDPGKDYASIEDVANMIQDVPPMTPEMQEFFEFADKHYPQRPLSREMNSR